MHVNVTVPARINILGNPTDANEGDFATISAAVDIRAGATVEPSPRIVLESREGTRNDQHSHTSQTFEKTDMPLAYDQQFDLVKAAFNGLYTFSDEFRSKLSDGGLRIATWTDVPAQGGLGGSSLFVLVTLAGLREFYGLDRRTHNDYVLSELAQRVESIELGITCGFADRYVPLFGGIAYIDYRGKLQQRDIGKDPYATYERLDDWVPSLPLVLVSSGVPRDSGDVHGRMRPRYLAEHAEWTKSGGDVPPMLRFMRGAWETAWRGKAALLAGDWEKIGALMNENHRLVDEMMSYCGFEDGAGWANNLLIRSALENGALGAKLTGAGGGGSVFALTQPGDEERVADVLGRAAKDAGLTDAEVYLPKISKSGLVVETN